MEDEGITVILTKLLHVEKVWGQANNILTLYFHVNFFSSISSGTVFHYLNGIDVIPVQLRLPSYQ